VPIDETGPWAEWCARDIIPREILIGLAQTFGLIADDEQSGCTPQKKIECRKRHGKYFDETCIICPDNTRIGSGK
jgi:hypothetical protein